MVYLHTLNLSENRLTDVPPELSGCVGLRDLDLYGNRLLDTKAIAGISIASTLGRRSQSDP